MSKLVRDLEHQRILMLSLVKVLMITIAKIKVSSLKKATHKVSCELAMLALGKANIEWKFSRNLEVSFMKQFLKRTMLKCLLSNVRI